MVLILEFVAVTRDITDKKVAESNLHESESQLRQIIDLVPHFIFVKDTTGKFLIVNKATAEVFGTTVEDLTGRRDAEFVATEEEMENFRADDLEVINSGEIKFIPEEEITDSENNIRYLQTTKVPFKTIISEKPALLGVAVDITERKNAEKALKKSEYVLNETQRISKVGGWEYYVKSGETYFSDEVFNIYGLPNEKMVKPDEGIKFYHPDDIQLVSDSFTKAISDGIPYDIEVRFINARGENLWVRTVGKPIYKNEKIVKIVGNLMDITEHKKAERTLKESEIQLRDLNATKDKFFSIIAHDLRSPFNTLMGFADLLNREFDKYSIEQKKRFISIIYESLQNTLKLLDNLLQWSLSQRGVIVFNPEKINLYLKAKETCDLLKQSAEKKSIKLINQLALNIHVEADGDMLATIIRNLLSNAIKYTRKSGEITIKTFLVPDENNIQYMGISVSDTGVGIPKEIQSKLFDVGETISTKGTENEKGTGLGLILCKEFVEKHGGKIWVESEVGKGSTFCFTIPK